MEVKKVNKVCLVDWVKDYMGIEFDINVIFDVQIKCLYEYKCQYFNMLYILLFYYCFINDLSFDMYLCVVFFVVKVVLGYYLVKEIIYVINMIVQKVNNDLWVGNKLKVVFIFDYCVSMVEIIILVVDVFEQILIVGKEVFGTGNMKMVFNGVLIIGMMDGVNVEICEEVGDDNIYIFGLEVDGVEVLKVCGYNLYDFYYVDLFFKVLLDLLVGEEFMLGVLGKLCVIYDSLFDGGDLYLVLVDFVFYVKVYEVIDKQYCD